MSNLIIPDLCGWQPHPDHVAQELAKLANPTFAQAAPDLMGTWDHKSDIPLWNIVKLVNKGQNLPADKQTIGDCVSHGFGRAIDYLQCIQIQLNSQNNQYTEGQDSAMSEAIYGEAREQGNALGGPDGAAGIWAIKALKLYGFVPRNNQPYNGNIAKNYGFSGTPSILKNAGRIRILQEYAQVKTIEELVNSLWHGYPVPICSNQGFTLTRNNDGICEAQGSWSHCMLCIGAYLLKLTNELIFVILQSWGQNMPSGPVPSINFPDNAFGARQSVVQRMLNAGDSYALAAIPGFPAQHDDLDFFV